MRQALIAVKAAIKEPDQKKQLQQMFEKQPQVLLDCLKAEDPKVRKNAALILGNLRGAQIPEHLWAGYEKEEQLFVKSDYLKAMASFDCSDYLDALKVRQKELEAALGQSCVKRGKENSVDSQEEKKETALEHVQEEDCKNTRKHLRQEQTEIRNILFGQGRQSCHRFVGYEEPVDVLLMTNKGCEKMLAEQVEAAFEQAEGLQRDGKEARPQVRPIKGGVHAEQVKVKDILPIRTYREILFGLKGSKRMPAEEASDLLLKTNLMELLEKLYEGPAPYYFRINCISTMEPAQKSAFCKQLAEKLEEKSAGALRNAPSAYEIEIRFVENKEGSFYPLLKLHTLADKRFAYRKYTVAASVAPVQAAICMELAAPYLKENAHVLDPFCGVGTMLLERNYKLHANTLYGVDLYAPAIQGARENVQIAGVPAHFINRDCRTFTHSYLFDEIVTNFPTQGKSLDSHGLDCLYGQFFQKAEQLLKEDGTILLYSRDRGYVKKQLRMNPSWKLCKEWCVSEKEGAYLFFIKKLK